MGGRTVGSTMRYPRMIVGVVLLTCAALRADEGWKPLFNGKDFTGWTRWLGKPHASAEIAGEPRDAEGKYAQPLGLERDPLGVFTVVTTDGQPAIHITGQVFGALTTKMEYGNYHLRLQMKWGEKKWAPREKPETPRDSGLLYHVHSPMNYSGRTWPRSAELQIQEHDIGDLYALGIQITVAARKLAETPKLLYGYDPKAEPVVFLEQKPIGNRCVKAPDNEKPNGEWNTVELVCVGDESLHIVNGKVVMRLTHAERIDGEKPSALTKGAIQLQSEGAELFFRNVELRPITAIPAEFAGEAR